MVKKSISIIISIFLLCTIFVTPAAAYKPSDFTVRAEGVILANSDTGEFIYDKNSTAKYFPASLTKIMTAIVVLDECADPQNTKVTVTKEALDALQGTDSALFVVEGEEFTTIDLLYVLLVKSGNDAANALAIHFGGSIDGFVKKMNAKAAELGMKNTNFVNPHGLHDENHYTTPADLFTLTKYALLNPTFEEIFGTKRYYVSPTNKCERKRILATTVFIQDPNSEMPSTYYDYVTGGKTGYTDPAGRCLITVAKKNGTSYICVLMKSPVKNEDGRKVRYEFEDTKKLFVWAFDTFEYRQIFDTSTPHSSCNVELGADTDQVSVVLQKPIFATVPKDAEDSSFEVVVELNSQTIEAPVKKGTVLGNATIKYGGTILSTVPVVALNTVEKSEWLGIGKILSDFFDSTFFKVVVWSLVAFIVLFLAYCVWINRNRKKRKRHTKNIKFKKLKNNQKDYDNKR